MGTPRGTASHPLPLAGWLRGAAGRPAGALPGGRGVRGVREASPSPAGEVAWSVARGSASGCYSGACHPPSDLFLSIS